MSGSVTGSSALGRQGRPLRVLCVDDNELVCGTLERRLHAPLFECVAALTSPGDLVERIQGDRPDLLVLDVNVPGYDMPSVIREVKRINSRLPVAALSGVDDNETIDAVLDAGADGYISKGEDSATVVNLLCRIAAGEVVLSPLITQCYAPGRAQ